MNDASTPREGSRLTLPRRNVLAAGGFGAATALAGLSIPRVHAAEDNTVQLALVGCGGRGTGAAADAMKTKGPTKLVAMADVFQDKLSTSYAALNSRHEKQMDVPDDRKFIGFDGYKQAMDALKPGDVVILTTPPAFRWVHLTYAIQKGLNVFMEKPVTVDGPSTRRMFKLAEEADKKGTKIAVGLMCRHCDARTELHKRIKDGEMGEILLLRAYRMAGLTGSAFAPKKPKDSSELQYQVRHFHGFLWLSGGGYSDFLIHNIDECCWMKDAWPIEAKASGGRHYRGDFVDQNFDTYSVEYTFADGTKLMLEGRTMPGCHHEFASYAHGTKGAATISVSGHTPAKCKIYKGQRFSNKEVAWAWDKPEPSPYQLEWDHFTHAIRENLPYNEAKRGAEASLVTSMGRMAAHTGRVITWDEMLECDHEFAPDADKLALDGPAPIQADADGKYPVPMPGLQTKREF